MEIIPLIRASNVQQNLKSLSMFDPTTNEKIIQLLSEDEKVKIQAAVRSEWLPLELDIRLTEAVAKVCGKQGLLDWSRKAILESANGPLLGPIMKGSIRLFGITPAGIYKLGPKIWNSVYRNCGDPVVTQVHPKLMHLVIDHVPSLLRQSEDYLLGIGGSFEAPLSMCKVKGTVKLDPSLVSPTSVCWVVSWE